MSVTETTVKAVIFDLGGVLIHWDPTPVFREQFADDADDAKREQLRYVLALLLMRRKALKLHDVQQDGEKEVLMFRRPRSKENLPVTDPGLDESQVDRLEEELAELLGTAPSPSE